MCRNSIRKLQQMSHQSPADVSSPHWMPRTFVRGIEIIDARYVECNSRVRFVLNREKGKEELGYAVLIENINVFWAAYYGKLEKMNSQELGWSRNLCWSSKMLVSILECFMSLSTYCSQLRNGCCPLGSIMLDLQKCNEHQTGRLVWGCS